MAVAWVWVVVALTSLPDDLCLGAADGRWASGECECERAVGEVMELRPREGGRSCAGEAF